LELRSTETAVHRGSRDSGSAGSTQRRSTPAAKRGEKGGEKKLGPVYPITRPKERGVRGPQVKEKEPTQSKNRVKKGCAGESGHRFWGMTSPRVKPPRDIERIRRGKNNLSTPIGTKETKRMQSRTEGLRLK